MQNPHLVVGENKRCLCGVYNIGGTRTPLACHDIHAAAAKLANQGVHEGLMLSVVLRELLEDME
jgi:hypothetical protein